MEGADLDVNAKAGARPDLDAVAGIGGLVGPRFTANGKGLEEEKENENVDEELLDMAAMMPLYSQQQSQDAGRMGIGKEKSKPSLDEVDDIDMLLDIEEPVDGMAHVDGMGHVDGYEGFFGDVEADVRATRGRVWSIRSFSSTPAFRRVYSISSRAAAPKSATWWCSLPT